MNANAEVHLRLAVWDHPRGRPATEAAVEAFQVEHPHVSVTVVPRNGRQFAGQSIEEAARSSDLIWLDHPHIPRAADRGALLRLDPLLPDTTREELAHDSVGRSWESCTWGGGLWALPVDAASQTSAGTKSSPTPQTWDDVVAMAATTPGSVRMPFSPHSLTCSVLSILRAYGVEPKAGRLDLDQDDRARVQCALGHLRVIAENCPDRCWTLGDDELLDDMLVSDTAIWTPLAFNYVTHSPALRFGPPPAGPEGRHGALGGVAVAVSATTAHPDVAVQLAVWLGGVKMQRGIVGSLGQPALVSAWPPDALFTHQTLAAVQSAFLRPRSTRWPVVQAELGTAMADGFRSGDPTKALFEAFESAWNF